MNPRQKRFFGTVFQIIGVLTVIYWAFIGVSHFTQRKDTPAVTSPTPSKMLALGVPYVKALTNGAQDITIPIIKLQQPSDEMVRIAVEVYELDNADKISPSKSEVKMEWKEPVDWQSVGRNYFHVSYPGPIDPAKSKYAGYEITLYYGSDEQDKFTDFVTHLLIP